MLIGVESKSEKTFKERKTNHPYRPLTLIILSWVGLALVGCAVVDLFAKPSSPTPAAPNGQKITLEKQLKVIVQDNQDTEIFQVNVDLPEAWFRGYSSSTVQFMQLL